GEPTHPIFISGPHPEYPAKARADKNMLNGIVVVSFTVDHNGIPANVAVDKSLRPDFDQSAIQAVKQYRFKPALLHGHPVEYPLTIDVDFQMF
ncbi:MAG TPA: energy transducer TonB, partial [Acidobacteriaceae bacterium]|nr:energy transducer TonB [Acidobacteriaceae bacterium]